VEEEEEKKKSKKLECVVCGRDGKRGCPSSMCKICCLGSESKEEMCPVHSSSKSVKKRSDTSMRENGRVSEGMKKIGHNRPAIFDQHVVNGLLEEEEECVGAKIVMSGLGADEMVSSTFLFHLTVF